METTMSAALSFDIFPDEPKAPEITVTVEPEQKVESDKDLRKKAKILIKQVDQSYMELGRVLHDVWNRTTPDGKPLWKAWGYGSFADYVQDELDLKYDKAKYLRRIWYDMEIRLKDMPQDLRDRAVAVGWTKLKHLVRAMTLENAAEWIARAETSNAETVRAQVTKYLDDLEENKAAAMPPDEKFYSQSFRLAEGQNEIVELALKRAGAVGDTDSRNQQLHLICLDFLATNYLGKADKDIQIKYLAKFEQILGKKLIVVEDNEILYGFKTLEEMAKDNE